MLVYFQSVIAIAIGIVSSITDFKNKKIYNKYLIVAIVLSVVIYLLFWKQIEIIYLKSFFINLFIGGIISFLFYYFKIWAAGDAKLFIVIIFMIPYEIYEVDTSNFFPSLYLLIIIFSVAFIYVFVETIYLWIKDKRKFENIKQLKIEKFLKMNFIVKYFMGYFIVLLINNISSKFFVGFKANNEGLVLLLNMLILFLIYRIIKNTWHEVIITVLFVFFNVLYYIFCGFQFYSINIKMLALVFAILIFRSISEKYNYQEIKIEDLKPRMILSYGSVLSFFGSRVKGLPQSATENTDSRLTEEEVKSIKRWSKTKKGKETITIVRHMPFAPFILIGELIFFIAKLYM